MQLVKNKPVKKGKEPVDHKSPSPISKQKPVSPPEYHFNWAKSFKYYKGSAANFTISASALLQPAN